MKTNGITRTSIALASAFALTVATAAAREHSRMPDKVARTTLEQVQTLARDASERAEIYERETMNGMVSSPERGYQLEAIRADVNRIGKDVAVLEAERPWLATWEQGALDRVAPELHIAAADTTRAIEYFNGHKSDLWNPENERTIEDLSSEATKIAATVGDYLKLETLQKSETKIEQQIGPTTGTSGR